MLLVLYDLNFKAHPEVSSATCRERGEDHSCVHHGWEPVKVEPHLLLQQQLACTGHQVCICQSHQACM